MTYQQKILYQPSDKLKEILKVLIGKKFILDCGHHVTFGFFLGNDVTILNGKKLNIVCSICGQ